MTSTQYPVYNSNYTFAINTGNVDIEKSGIQISATVCSGNSIKFQVDTGSNGIVLNSDDISSNYTNYPCFGYGEMHYQPSNIIYSGEWYLLPVSLSGVLNSSGKPVGGDSGSAIGMAMVLVTSGTGAHPKGTGMMGVAGKGQNPAFNLFFNLTGQYTANGTTVTVNLAPAYAISLTQSGSAGNIAYTGTINVGQTHTAGDGFNIVAMQPVTPPPLPNQQSGYVANINAQQAWASPSVNASILNLNSASGSNYNLINFTGGLELDTGLAQSIIAPTPEIFDALSSSYWATTVNETTTITAPSVFMVSMGLQSYQKISVNVRSMSQFLNPSNSFRYLFGKNLSTDQEDVLETLHPDKPPLSVVVKSPSNWNPNTVRFNLGRMPLTKYTYLYDALNGVMGFKSNA